MLSTQQNSHKRKTKARKKTHKPNCSKRNKKKRERERKQNNSIKPTLYFVFPLSQFPSHKPHQKNEHLNHLSRDTTQKNLTKGKEKIVPKAPCSSQGWSWWEKVKTEPPTPSSKPFGKARRRMSLCTSILSTFQVEWV